MFELKSGQEDEQQRDLNCQILLILGGSQALSANETGTAAERSSLCIIFHVLIPHSISNQNKYEVIFIQYI